MEKVKCHAWGRHNLRSEVSGLAVMVSVNDGLDSDDTWRSSLVLYSCSERLIVLRDVGGSQ